MDALISISEIHSKALGLGFSRGVLDAIGKAFASSGENVPGKNSNRPGTCSSSELMRRKSTEFAHKRSALFVSLSQFTAQEPNAYRRPRFLTPLTPFRIPAVKSARGNPDPPKGPPKCLSRKYNGGNGTDDENAGRDITTSRQSEKGDNSAEGAIEPIYDCRENSVDFHLKSPCC
jgi:hypothetical protein